jgi:hypothetical protein
MSVELLEQKEVIFAAMAEFFTRLECGETWRTADPRGILLFLYFNISPIHGH